MLPLNNLSYFRRIKIVKGFVRSQAAQDRGLRRGMSSWLSLARSAVRWMIGCGSGATLGLPPDGHGRPLSP